MYPQEIHQYISTFFKETDCDIKNEHAYYLTVQLTADIDKRIMNRPYYWQYIENTNSEPAPFQLTFITDANQLTEKVKGEVIHFGSARLNQLFKATREMGAFVQLYEFVEATIQQQLILTPWLGVNYKISYCSDQTKEMLYSLGINLMTGEVIDGFQELISNLNLHPQTTGNVFCLPYTIKPIRGAERLDHAIENLIQQDDHSWAEEAKVRLEKDRRVLAYFYEGVEEKPACYEIEQEALTQQYETKIKIDIINGGMFYLR